MFVRDGLVHRQVNASFRDEYELMMSSGFHADAARRGLLIPHELEVVKTYPANDAVQIFMLELQSMRINPELPDAEFGFPEDGAAPAPPDTPKPDTPEPTDGKKRRWY